VSTTTPELLKDVKKELAALRTLSEKVEKGDKSARKKLRKAVRESSSEVISRASDISRRGQWALIQTAAANDPLTEEALLAQVELIRADVAGPDPSPLELLLTERLSSIQTHLKLRTGAMPYVCIIWIISLTKEPLVFIFVLVLPVYLEDPLKPSSQRRHPSLAALSESSL
jgi:hypothetical protein